MLDVTRLPLQGNGGLIDVLAEVADPRMRRGVRHPVVVVVALAVCAMLSGCRSLVAIGEWAQEQPRGLLRRLGSRRSRAPSESTFRRVLARMSPVAFERQMGHWFQGLGPMAGEAIALDGKTLRGSGDGEGPAPHLVSALLHRMRTVIAQVKVADKTNEIGSVGPLLQGSDIRGAIVTGDAMFAQRAIAQHLVEDKGADYLFTVKDNQPTLRSDIEALELDATPPSGAND